MSASSERSPTLWVVVKQLLVHPIVGVADERPEFGPRTRAKWPR
jgi:hypothetical protein